MKIWPFHRNQPSEDLPEDIQEFYDAEQKKRSGMAWLLALATLVVTILLAIALFYGGRWIYQRIAGDDNVDQPVVTEQTVEETVSGDETIEQQDTSSSSTDQPSVVSPDEDSQSQVLTPGTGATEVPDTGPGPAGLQ